MDFEKNQLFKNNQSRFTHLKKIMDVVYIILQRESFSTIFKYKYIKN